MTDYITVEEFKDRVGLQDTEDDILIAACITAASVAIDSWCGYLEGFTPDTSATARLYYPDCDSVCYTDAISETVSLVVKTDLGDDGTYETTWAATDFQLGPLNAIVNGLPYTELSAVGTNRFPTSSRRAPIQVTAKWGFPAVPAPVLTAAHVLTQDLYKMKDVTFGASSTLTEFGPLTVSRAVNRVAASLLSDYRKPSKVVG